MNITFSFYVDSKHCRCNDCCCTGHTRALH